jgi:hypothetical protein
MSCAGHAGDDNQTRLFGIGHISCLAGGCEAIPAGFEKPGIGRVGERLF